MKARLFTVFALAIGLALLITWAIGDQGSKAASDAWSGAPSASIDRAGLDLNDQNTANLGHTSDIVFTPTFTSYLPAVLRNLVVCASVPTLLSPASGSSPDTIAPLFQWDDGNDSGATQLRLAVSKDPDFASSAASLWSYYSPGQHQFRFSRNFDPATTYYWRAWHMCGDTPGPYSEVWSFTTGSGGMILPAPALVAPANGSTLPSTKATLQWSSVSGAEEYVVRWRRAGMSGYSWTWTSDTQHTVDCGANTTCEWWVAARNNYAVGADSPTWQFTTPAQVFSLPPQDLDGYFTLEQDGASGTFEYYR